ncbi:unnamed protein product, partial [Mesorhabditis belari]|uniref:Uncharacterized protein n=1 Tax=Mesorhabditis belari TaxID=2138241 RepID=A0AAF3EEN6_9BILA
MRVSLSIFVFLSFLLSIDAMRKQGVAVKGKLMCGLTPAKDAKVRIVDLDTGPDPDDTLDEKRVGDDGLFSLTGTTHELTPIDPVLYIWHECKDEDKACSRKLRFTIPKKFIHNGNPTEEQWVDIGVLNLEGAFDKEERECIK